jgi:hypothetical protein
LTNGNSFADHHAADGEARAHTAREDRVHRPRAVGQRDGPNSRFGDDVARDTFTFLVLEAYVRVALPETPDYGLFIFESRSTLESVRGRGCLAFLLRGEIEESCR